MAAPKILFDWEQPGYNSGQAPPTQTYQPTAQAQPERQILFDWEKPGYQAPAPVEEPGLLSRAYEGTKGAFLGAKRALTGEEQQTEATQRLPELASSRGISTGEFGKDLRIAAGLMFAADDSARKDIILENAPGSKITQDEKGNDIVTFPDGKQAILNQPGASMQDFTQLLGDVALFYGPGKLTGLGRSAAAKIGIGAAAAGATEAGRELATQQIGSKQEVSPVNVGIAAGLGGAGEAVGAGVRAVKEGRQARQLGVAKGEVEAAREALGTSEALTSATGIPLYQAQKTMDPAALQKQAFIAWEAPASAKAAEALKEQNKAAYDAVEGLMQRIATPEGAATGTRRVRDVSRQAIEAQKAIRAEKASPLYSQAFSDKKPVIPESAFSAIAEAKTRFPEGGAVQGVLSKIERILGSKETGSNLKRLHGAKLELDDMLSKFGEGSLGNTEKRELAQIKEALLNDLDAASPAYREARETFARESPAVTELTEGLIGGVAKIEDVDLPSVARKLFDPSQEGYNPSMINKARTLIESTPEGKDAWNGLLRAKLEMDLGKIKGLDAAAESVENVPAKLRDAIFGNDRQRKVLYASLPDKEIEKNFTYLEEALRRAGSGRPWGSPTKTRENIDKSIMGGVANSIRGFFGETRKFLAGIGEEEARRLKYKAVAEVMFDPQWKPKLAEIRKLDPKSEKAAREFGLLLKASLQNITAEK